MMAAFSSDQNSRQKANALGSAQSSMEIEDVDNKNSYRHAPPELLVP